MFAVGPGDLSKELFCKVKEIGSDIMWQWLTSLTVAGQLFIYTLAQNQLGEDQPVAAKNAPVAANAARTL